MSPKKSGPNQPSSPHPDKQEQMLRGIAALFSVDLEALRAEVKMKTVLGKIARSILDLPEAGNRQGKPPNLHEDLELLRFKHARKELTQSEITDAWLMKKAPYDKATPPQTTEEVAELREELRRDRRRPAVNKRFRAAEARWAGVDQVVMLFFELPAG
ncbi:hypothetical protein [Hoeflea sp.]|uniref:hypothetical protein n=1 Tax=Hoeflea sp. TaxID=1940281 RepID=UPI003A90A22F